jgi:hypothetical protein
MPSFAALAQQLMAYSPVVWAVIAVTTFGLAWYGRVYGVFAAHLLVAAVIAVLDVRWVQEEMSRPGWQSSGGPDLDGLFLIGVLLRIVLINVVLLPAAGLGIFLRRRPVARCSQGPLSASGSSPS